MEPWAFTALKIVKVIVNADDLGASSAVNDSSFDLMDQKLVTSATIIANGPYAQDACRMVNRYPQCSFGVHLNVTEFAPLSGRPELDRLLDRHGKFDHERTREVAIDSTLAEGIFREFCAQIQKLMSLGVNVGHIDSHHHIHTMPRIFPILKRVQKRFNIRRVRISRNLYRPDERISPGLKFKKAVYNLLLRHYYRTKTTQGFGDFTSFYQTATSQTLHHERVEVMVHPGSDLYGIDEIELLRGPWRDNLGFTVRLINYSNLG